MKKSILLVLCVVLTAMLLSGCVSVNFLPGSIGIAGTGTPEVYTIPVGEITEIHVESFCDIIYYSAPSDTVTLEIQPNLREYFTVEESNGVLTVKSTRSISWTSKTPVLTVSTPALNRLSLTGAGTFSTQDTITSDSFTLSISGAGSGKASLDVERLTVTLSGAGSFKLSGKADKASYTLSGAGELDALSLQAREADVKLSGVGAVRLSCSEFLSITAGGVGSVEYRGSPRLNLNKDGLVTITQIS